MYPSEFINFGYNAEICQFNLVMWPVGGLVINCLSGLLNVLIAGFVTNTCLVWAGSSTGNTGNTLDTHSLVIFNTKHSISLHQTCNTHFAQLRNLLWNSDVNWQRWQWRWERKFALVCNTLNNSLYPSTSRSTIDNDDESAWICRQSSLKSKSKSKFFIHYGDQWQVNCATHLALNNTTYNASQTEIITRGVQLKYGGSVWHQEPGHLLQKWGRPPSLAGQPLQGLPKMQGHSVRQWQQKFSDLDGIHMSSLSAVGDRGGGWL